MDLEELRKLCLAFPGATEDVKWAPTFASASELRCSPSLAQISSSPGLSIKCSPDDFAELIEREGIAPAAYVGRYGWVHLDTLDAVAPAELKALIGKSYDLVHSKLPKNIREQIR